MAFLLVGLVAWVPFRLLAPKPARGGGTGCLPVATAVIGSSVWWITHVGDSDIGAPLLLIPLLSAGLWLLVFWAYHVRKARKPAEIPASTAPDSVAGTAVSPAPSEHAERDSTSQRTSQRTALKESGDTAAGALEFPQEAIDAEDRYSLPKMQQKWEQVRREQEAIRAYHDDLRQRLEDLARDPDRDPELTTLLRDCLNAWLIEKEHLNILAEVSNQQSNLSSETMEIVSRIVEEAAPGAIDHALLGELAALTGDAIDKPADE